MLRIVIAWGITGWILLTTNSAFAQKQVCRGIIYSEAGEVIAFASIKWKDDSSGIVKQFCISDSAGHFTLEITHTERGWLEVSALGYETNIQKLQLAFLRDSTFNIVLNKRVKELSRILIIGRPSIRISGDTTFYLADKFKRGNENNLSQLLSNIPGFYISSQGTIIYAGKPITKVMLNGDDLTGNEYTTLVKNLDIAGIDELQVIKNFADNNYITSRLEDGKEQVLNIKYKDGFLRRLFGNIEGKQGIPAKFYDYRLQCLGLYDKTKIVCIGRVSTEGTTKITVNDDQKSYEAGKSIYDFDLLSPHTFADINDITGNNMEVNRIYKNNSSAGDVYFSTKPVKKIAIRGILSLFNDIYHQNLTTITSYFSGNDGFRISQNNKLKNRLEHLTGTLSFNYIPNSRNQLVITVKKNVVRRNASASTSINNSDLFTENQSKNENQFGVKFLYNLLFNKSTSLSVSTEYLKSKLPNLYIVTPPLFIDFFHVSDSCASLLQQEKNLSDKILMNVKVIRHIGTHVITLGVEWNKEAIYLNNQIAKVSRNTMEKNWISPDSVNDINETESVIRYTIKDKWQINKYLSISYAGSFFSFKNQVTQANGLSPAKYSQGIRFLPIVNLSIRLSDKRQITISQSMIDKPSNINFLGKGYAIQNNTSIFKGIDTTVGMSTVFSMQGSYSCNNIFQKRRVFFLNIAYVKAPLFYIPQIYNYSSFIYSKYLSTGNYLNTLSLTLSTQKYSMDYKNKISQVFTIVSGNTFYMFQGRQDKIRFRQLSFDFGFDTEIKKIQLKTNVRYDLLLQKNSNQESVFNQNFSTLVDINKKIFDRIFLVADIKNYVLKSQKVAVTDLLLIDAQVILDVTKEKFDIGIQGLNILGKQSFSTLELSPNISTFTSFQLFPRIIGGFIKYRF